MKLKHWHVGEPAWGWPEIQPSKAYPSWWWWHQCPSQDLFISLRHLQPLPWHYIPTTSTMNRTGPVQACAGRPRPGWHGQVTIFVTNIELPLLVPGTWHLWWELCPLFGLAPKGNNLHFPLWLSCEYEVVENRKHSLFIIS